VGSDAVEITRGSPALRLSLFSSVFGLLWAIQRAVGSDAVPVPS